MQENEKKFRNPLKVFFHSLGPGLITGAADDDPSGIATYSIAGAQFGTTFLWVSWLTWPLMMAVQMMCARIGMVKNEGLAGALSKKLPRPVMLLMSVALMVANIINIGADLAGMGDAAQVLTGINSAYYVIMLGLLIGAAIVRFRYYQIAHVLKWLALALFAYIATAFLIHPDWSLIADAMTTPSIPKNDDEWGMLVAILGTTISPYLFFWQASQEVEERKAKGRRMVIQDTIERREFVERILDVGAGTLLSNVVMFFIIVTTAFTLHKHGITNIESSKQAAEALRPLAGNLTMALYTIGIVGVGLLAIPTLAGSSAYAFAEIFNWDHGLDEKLHNARAFYAIIIISVLCGIALVFLDINPIKALYWSAVINGVLAPFILLGILLVAANPVIMRQKQSSKFSQIIVAITTILMFGAAVGMFIFTTS